MSIFNVPKRRVGKEICLRPSMKLAAVNICQMERVCALQKWLCHRCNHRFRIFLVHT